MMADDGLVDVRVHVTVDANGDYMATHCPNECTAWWTPDADIPECSFWITLRVPRPTKAPEYVATVMEGDPPSVTPVSILVEAANG